MKEPRPARTHRIVPLAALTGMRRGELFALTDRQVDLEVGTIMLRITKTRKPRKVWLCAEAKQLVREQLLARTPKTQGYLFTTRRGSRLGTRFEKSFRNSVEVAGLDGATFHALRHTCASLMIASKANSLGIAEQLGHMRGGTTRRHDDLEAVRMAVRGRHQDGGPAPRRAD